MKIVAASLFKKKIAMYPVVAAFFFSQIFSAPAWSETAPVELAGENTVQTISPDEAAPDSFGNVLPVDPPPATLAQMDNALSTATLEANANVTALPGRPVVTLFSNEAVITVDQTSSSQFKLNYDINTPGSFGGAIINFGASPSGPQNLSAITSYDFEIATNNVCAAGVSCLKVEFLDAAGQLAVVDIDSLTAAPSAVSITQAELLAANPALDLTQIQQINFVVDENIAPTTKAGFYDIQIGGLAFTPTLTAAAPAGTPTQFPGTPAVTTFANQSTATVEQTSDTLFRVNYDVTTAGSFAGAIINYDPAAAGTFQDLSGFSNFVFNLSTDNVCTGGKCLKIEIVDTLNHVAAFNVEGVVAASKQVIISQALILEANNTLDLTHIKQINFVIEEGNTTPKAGFLNVETGGFNGTVPTPNPNPNPEPEPNPNPNPDPDTNPNPNPQPAETLFTGVTEGQTVSGIVTFQPDLVQTPDIRKVAYYLNGTKAGRSYESPFVWDGTDGMDTSKLSDGTYELTAVYTTPAGDQTYTVRFTVNNGNAGTPEPQPQPAPENAVKGLTANQTVSGIVTVEPDLIIVPDVHKVFYYLDGTRLDRVYQAPFSVEVDTAKLESGPHVLTVVYGTTDADFLNPGEFMTEIPFTVGAGTAPAVETSAISEVETETTTTFEAETAADAGALTLTPADAAAAPAVETV